MTVRVAPSVATEPPPLVKTARNSQPLTKGIGIPLSVVEVYPAASIQVMPPSTETCHCTLGVGVPLAAAVKVTGSPWATDWLTGWVVTTGAMSGRTVIVAAVLVAVPAMLEKNARSCHPLTKRVGIPVTVVELNPKMEIQVLPPSTETSHCSFGVG